MTESINLILRIAMLLALYTFVFFAIWTLWKSIEHTSTASNQAVPPIILSTEGGQESKQSRFTSAEVLLGRDQYNDFPLEHSTVSARHARLIYRQNQWWFEDLNSTNGSYLDNLRIEEPIVLKDGDLIQCGEVAINVEILPFEKGAPHER